MSNSNGSRRLDGHQATEELFVFFCNQLQISVRCRCVLGPLQELGHAKAGV